MPLEQRWELRIRAGATSRLARSLGVSRAGLARLAGLSESTLYRVDVGERPGNQTLAALLRLAMVSDVPFQLGPRLFRYLAIAEAAEITSHWTESAEESASLRFAAGSLRSAYHLWLEDTDLSLPCLRILLEQVCRARAWRLKPTRAARVAASYPTPARWIEASGWKRARVLGRALGEFSHLGHQSRRTGARRLLEAIQGEVNEEQRPYTARGHALDQTAYLLAAEVIDRLTAVSDDLAEGFRAEVTLLETSEHAAHTESFLQKALMQRAHDFGAPDGLLRKHPD